VWFYFPETKGVILEEMQRRLGIADHPSREVHGDYPLGDEGLEDGVQNL
jgi:hypothetical protein